MFVGGRAAIPSDPSRLGPKRGAFQSRGTKQWSNIERGELQQGESKTFFAQNWTLKRIPVEGGVRAGSAPAGFHNPIGQGSWATWSTRASLEQGVGLETSCGLFQPEPFCSSTVCFWEKPRRGAVTCLSWHTICGWTGNRVIKLRGSVVHMCMLMRSLGWKSHHRLGK